MQDDLNKFHLSCWPFIYNLKEHQQFTENVAKLHVWLKNKIYHQITSQKYQIMSLQIPRFDYQQINNRMEESDNMLIAGLRDFVPVPEDIATLRDIRTDQIYTLSIVIFDALKADTSEIKSINRSQRFRSMTKLTQTLNKEMDTQFELNDIMNPTLPFLRKLLLTFISRLGAVQGERTKFNAAGPQETNTQQFQKQVLKKWVQEQYICPELRTNNKKIKYQPYRLKLDLNKHIFKRDICPQLSNMPGNAACILANSISKLQLERKKKEAEQGITKKNDDGSRNVIQILRNNQKDWAGAEKTVNRMKKNMIQIQKEQEEQEKNNEKTQEASQHMTVFQQEVSVLTEETKQLKQNSQVPQTRVSQISNQQELPEDPLERIKRQCQLKKIQLERKLQELLAALNSKKEQIQQREQLKKKLQEKMHQLEQKTASQKQMRHQLKKKAQKQKLLLDSLQGGADIEAEVKQLEQEVSYLQKEAQKQIDSMSTNIEGIKKQGDRKLEVLGDLKLKLNKIENDYQNICEQIEDKIEIKNRVKINKSGLSRLYYSKKITEMELRWRQTQKEAKKNNSAVENVREDIRRSVLTAERIQTQIQNMTNTGKLRSEGENMAFKELFRRCQKTFQLTMKAIQKINETKNQIQQYEMKVHSLAGKDYKENIKRLEAALEDLKKEMSQIQNKK